MKVKLEHVSQTAVSINSYAELCAAAKGPNNEGGFTPFLAAVFKYVMGKMEEVSLLDDEEEGGEMNIGGACRILSLSEEFVKKRCLYYQTNHTNFFMCLRLKMHPIRNFADTMNAQLQPSHAGVHALEATTLKFFPRNNFDSIKVLAVKPVTDGKLHGEHRYINP